MDLYIFIIPFYSIFFAILCAIIGIILDWREFKSIFWSPSRIVIGVFCNLVFLPLVSNFFPKLFEEMKSKKVYIFQAKLWTQLGTLFG